jgi:hypothetical protein
MDRKEDRNCGENREGDVYKRKIVTRYWETIII